MASNNLNIPGFTSGTQITEKGDRPSSLFVNWMNGILTAISSAVNQNTAAIALLAQQQALLIATQQSAAVAQAAASAAQTTADNAAGAGAVSGNDQGVIDFSSTFVTAASVTLTGVSAGTLTISGSGPQQGNSTDFSLTNTTRSGNWQIVEIQGVTSTVLFVGTFQVSKFYDGELGVQQIYLYNDTDPNLINAAIGRASTGTMTYELQLIMPGPPLATVFQCIGQLYVRRS